jgi:hypothetical protein
MKLTVFKIIILFISLTSIVYGSNDCEIRARKKAETVYTETLNQCQSMSRSCQSKTSADLPECRCSAPEYCSSVAYGDTLACANSHPTYCSSISYSDKKACRGSNPSYCNSTNYANSPA